MERDGETLGPAEASERLARARMRRDAWRDAFVYTFRLPKKRGAGSIGMERPIEENLWAPQKSVARSIGRE